MVTKTFTAGQDFTVPDGVFSLTLELEGEAGESAGGGGGSGGRVVGDVSTVPGEVFRIRETFGGGSSFGGNGGNAIDIRLGGTTLSDRLAVGAGGGGGGGGGSGGGGGGGGAGGADTGADGSAGGSQFSDAAGEGGTQTTGGLGGTGSTDGQDGSFGTGGDGGDGNRGGGGGAGWYGGGGGGSGDSAFSSGGSGGGGGSNYDDGLDSVTANERGTSTRTHGQGGLVTITYEQTPGAENLAITDTTTTSNTLDWDAPTLPPEVDSVEQYRVYRATAPGTVRADYTEVATTPTPGFEDAGLDNGTEYHYRIGADLFVPEVPVEDWDSYSTGTVAPGSWTNINGGGQVSDVRAFSTPNSYLVSDDLGGAGAKYIEWATTPSQYTFNWDFRIYENESLSSRAAVRFDNENGDSILYVGTNSPNILVEGASIVEVDPGTPESWQGVRVSFDWGAGEATVSYRSADFSTVLGSETVSLKSVSPLNIGGISFTYGGESATWGGTSNEVYWDDCTITNE